MIKGLVSVVVPVYNVEQYLDRCVKSIVSQTYSNLEILLIDDGSPDNCPHKCDEWANRDSRIRVVHKINAGLGMARNTGIDHSNGEYICFIDSDDYIAPHTIEKAFHLAKANNADVVSYGYCTVDKDGKIVREFKPSTDKNVYSGEDVLEYILPNMLAPNCSAKNATNLWMSMCGGLYSSACIENANWRMVSERQIISEDTYSLLKLYGSVDRVVVYSECCYFYCENESSLTHVFKKDRFSRIKIFYDECVNAAIELAYSEKIMNYLAYPYLSNTIAALKMIVQSDLSSNEKREEFSKIVNDAHLQKVLKKYDMSEDSFNRKLLFRLLKNKMVGVCYELIKIKA